MKRRSPSLIPYAERKTASRLIHRGEFGVGATRMENSKELSAISKGDSKERVEEQIVENVIEEAEKLSA